jgi:hypothetical protein
MTRKFTCNGVARDNNRCSSGMSFMLINRLDSCESVGCTNSLTSVGFSSTGIETNNKEGNAEFRKNRGVLGNEADLMMTLEELPK